MKHHVFFFNLLCVDHEIDEIRLRALNNVVSKLNLGFQCDCNAVRKELLVKLFKWFSMESIGYEDNVLDLLIKLTKVNNFLILISLTALILLSNFICSLMAII